LEIYSTEFFKHVRHTYAEQIPRGETKNEVRKDTQNRAEEQLPQICKECLREGREDTRRTEEFAGNDSPWQTH
jgi:hypothetical protein